VVNMKMAVFWVVAPCILVWVWSLALREEHASTIIRGRIQRGIFRPSNEEGAGPKKLNARTIDQCYE
jgi:hypothetical protein